MQQASVPEGRLDALVEPSVDTTPDVVDAVALARLYGEPLFSMPADLYIPPDALEVFLETFQGPLDLCTKNALHGTLLPEEWKGDRMWIVALYPPYVEQEDTACSLKREIICEALYWHRNSGVET